MRNLTRLGFVFTIFVLSFFSNVLFSIADALIFSIKSDITSLALDPLANATTTVSIILDPLNTYLDQNLYSITGQVPCTQVDSGGDCIDTDPTPNLCKYLAIDPINGENYDYGFYKNPMQDYTSVATGRLFYDGKHQTDWRLTMTAPCFEGECPTDYDPYKNGDPLPQSMKGKTFKCNLSVKFIQPIFQSTRGIAYGDVLSNDTVEISAVIGKKQLECTKDCFSNVTFIPGLEASRLYAKGSDPGCPECEGKLWEPVGNVDGRNLFLDGNGKSTTTLDIYTRDVIDTA